MWKKKKKKDEGVPANELALRNSIKNNGRMVPWLEFMLSGFMVFYALYLQPWMLSMVILLFMAVSYFRLARKIDSARLENRIYAERLLLKGAPEELQPDGKVEVKKEGGGPRV